LLEKARGHPLPSQAATGDGRVAIPRGGGSDDAARSRTQRCAENAGMRAVVYDRYGPADVLRIEEIEPPVPTEDEVLVRVRAAAVTRSDCATREANRRGGLAISLISRAISGFPRPRQPVLGSEFAGEVAGVGT